MNYKIILPNEIKDLKIYSHLHCCEFEANSDDIAIQAARTVQMSIHQQMNYIYGLTFNNIGFDVGNCVYRMDNKNFIKIGE